MADSLVASMLTVLGVCTFAGAGAGSFCAAQNGHGATKAWMPRSVRHWRKTGAG
jgi:hypothetical protein